MNFRQKLEVGRYAAVVLISLCAYSCFSQVPFSSYRPVRLPTVERQNVPQLIFKTESFRLDAANQKQVRLDSVNVADSGQNEVDYQKAYDAKRQYVLQEITKADYFQHVSANIEVIQNAQKFFPTVNGEVVNYRLALFTHKKLIDPETNEKWRKGNKTTRKQLKEENETEPRVHYLPFSIISKISANYLDSAAGPTSDATSFFGAPLTFRFSPVFDCTPDWRDYKIFLGANGDLRLMILGDTLKQKLETSWGVYGSAGFSFLANAFAFEGDSEPDDESKRYDGKWSLSAMLYWFKSGGQFNRLVFGDYEKKTMAGVEVLIRFNTTKKENSRFNLLLGASNGFTPGAPNFAKWQFRVGFGT